MSGKVAPQEAASHGDGPRHPARLSPRPENDDAPGVPRLNVRRGSNRLMQMFESRPSNELHLDLDEFYESRMRRRTMMELDLTSTLVGNASSGPSSGTLSSETTGPPKGRGIMMTLSPGEEYENYQKVNAATQFQQSTLVGEDDDEEENSSNKFGSNRRMRLSIDRGDGTADPDGSLNEEDDESDSDDATSGTGPIADSHEKREPVTTRSSTGRHADRDRDRRKSLGSPALPQPVLQPTLHRLLHTSSSHAHTFLSTKMINPHGRFRLIWDVLSIIFIFYNAIVLPFQASFSSTNMDEDWFDKFLDGFFLFDILVMLNTAVEIEGSVRYDRKLVAKTYVRSWFIVDLVAALPYSTIFPSDSTSHALRNTLKLLRLVRLLRLFRISRILRRIQNTVFIRSTLSALLKYCLMVMFVSHWFSCIFHAIGQANPDGSNWIVRNRLQEPYADKWDRYVAALYFSVMTLATIGYGDISGQNADERLYSIFAMIIGGGIFAYGITNIVELVSSLTIQETRFRQKMDEVNEYMGARELPMKLRIEIREFYHNTRQSRESKLNGEQQILNELSSKLRSKIALSINDQFLRKFPFFTGSDPNFLLELALNMRMIHFAPLEDVIVEGEVGHEMFFVFRGAVEILRENTQIGILGENQYFGEMAILSPDNRRRASVRTLCFCELRMLSRNRFLEALALFPAMQAKMADVARARAPLRAVNHKVHANNGSGNGNGHGSSSAASNGTGAGSTSNRGSIGASVIAAAAAAAGIRIGSRNKVDKLPVAPQPVPDVDLSVDAPVKPHIPPPRLSIVEGLSSASQRALGHNAHASAVAAAVSPTLRGIEQQQHDAVLPIRATTSARLNIAVRRNSSLSAPGVSASMALALTETSARLEESARRQNALMTRVLKLQSDLELLFPSAPSHSSSD